MNKDNKIKWIILMLIENYSFPIVLISILLGNNFYSNLIWALYSCNRIKKKLIR